MILVILVLTGVSVGGSMLIRDYFVERKQHELTNKAYEMARMVNAYYDGHLTYSQLHNFVNSVDSFLDARVWVVDKELNLITVSEERPDEGQGNRRPASVVKPSPMHSTLWDCDLQGGMVMPQSGQQPNREQPRRQGQSESKQDIPAGSQAIPPRTNNWNCDWPSGTTNNSMGDRRSERDNMMGGMGWRPRTQNNQPVQPSRSAAVVMPLLVSDSVPQTDNLPSTSKGQTSIVLDVGQGVQISETPSAVISLTDIKGMTEITQTIEVNYGKSWAKMYYHPYYEENMLIVAVPLQRSDGTVNGTVMINAPIEEMNNFLQRIYYYIGLAGFVAIMLAILLAAYMARHIVRPVKAMQETAAAMAHGDYDQRVVVSNNDEVGELGHSLNALAHDLGEYVQQLETTDKMRRDFVANVSHELRTPLTIMHGYNQALQDGTITEVDKVKKYHRVMGDEIIRLEKLIAELLDLSQLQVNGVTLEAEDVPLSEVVDNVMTLLKQKSEQKGVLLTSCVDPTVQPVLGDGDRLTQLVLILMDNALKFTPSGGQISASVENRNDRTILTISDTGTGVSPCDLPHIWERFYKADKSRASGGTGLGLAIAKQIIEIHDATVEVSSACDKGTTFIIQFPQRNR